MQNNSGTLAVATGRNDRSDHSEGDVIFHRVGRGVERVGRLAFVEVVDQPASEAAAVSRGDAAGERAPGGEVVIGGTATAAVKLDALESVPVDHDTSITRIVDVDCQGTLPSVAG